MTPLESYLDSRFGPEFDVLNDKGGVPEELLECLKRGAIVEAMKARAKALGTEGLFYTALNFWCDGDEIGYVHDGKQYNRAMNDLEAVFALFTEGTDFLTKHIDQPTT